MGSTTIRRMSLVFLALCFGVALAMVALPAGADVFNMPDGMTNLETVPVGNPGNAADTRYVAAGSPGYGAVDYTYSIGKYEVTAGQYCQFLNAVATTDDPYALYSDLMYGHSGDGCQIQRLGSPGSYSYQVAADYADRPINYVSLWDGYRFSNWLCNGQPTGPAGAGTTETGAYTLNGYNGQDGRWIIRNAGATWVIPTEDEWYKAGYYDPNKPGGAGYWDYPTRSNTAPGRDMSEATNPGNNANYYISSSPYIAIPIDSGVYWTTEVGQFDLSLGPYGTFDLGGNVGERNSTVVASSSEIADYGIRGGAYGSSADILKAASRYFRNPVNSAESPGLGLRVAQVPEPSSIILLILGGFTLGKRRTPSSLAKDKS